VTAHDEERAVGLAVAFGGDFKSGPDLFALEAEVFNGDCEGK
jgi:hypothetical protein